MKPYILIYERGTGVPGNKMKRASVIIERDTQVGWFYVHKNIHEKMFGSFSALHPLNHLHAYLTELVAGFASYDIETLAEDYSPAVTVTQLPSNFEKFIRNPQIVWYGPHECPVCGMKIVKSSIESGGIVLDYNHDCSYPNHQWKQHVCQ